jgi:hypothetical protein
MIIFRFILYILLNKIKSLRLRLSLKKVNYNQAGG